MKIIPIFKAKIENGHLKLDDQEYQKYKRFCSTKNGEIKFILKKEFPRRSLKSNAWYWGAIVESIAKEIGEDALVVHAYLKAKFLSKELVVAGKDNKWDKQIIAGRTAKLTTEKFGEYIEKCRVWAGSFLGLEIPDADPRWRMREFLIEED